MQMSPLMQEARTVIDDVADWMDEVFMSRRGRSGGRKSSSAGQERRASACGEDAGATHSDYNSTPFASETELETETDDPLTFSPKKRSPPGFFADQPPRRGSGAKPATAVSKSMANGNGSVEGLGNGACPLNGAESDAGAHQPLPVVSQDMLHGAGIALPSPMLAAASGTKPASSLPCQRQPSPPGKSGSPGKAGRRISESELMRRRRLLDSHLIPSDSSPNLK